MMDDPGYPPELIAHLRALVPGPCVLEIGTGPGRLDAGLHAAGFAVTCVEPCPTLAPEGVTDVLPAGAEGFDAVISAGAWQRTDPATRLDRAAELLRPAGLLALVRNTGVLGTDDAQRAVQELVSAGERRPFEPYVPAALDDVPDPESWMGDEMIAHGSFVYLGARTFSWRQTCSAPQYAAHLRAASWFQVLAEPVRDQVLAGVVSVLAERFDGTVEMTWRTQCYAARRVL